MGDALIDSMLRQRFRAERDAVRDHEAAQRGAQLARERYYAEVRRWLRIREAAWRGA